MPLQTDADVSILIAAITLGLSSTLVDTAVRALGRPLTASERQSIVENLRANLEESLAAGREANLTAPSGTFEALSVIFDRIVQGTDIAIRKLNP